MKAVHGKTCIFSFSVCVSVAQGQNETYVMWLPVYNRRATPCLPFPYEKNIMVSTLKHIWEISHLKWGYWHLSSSWKAKFQLYIKVPRVCKLERRFDFVYTLESVWACLTWTWHDGCIGQQLKVGVPRVSQPSPSLAIIWEYMLFEQINQNKSFLGFWGEELGWSIAQW